MTVEVNVEEKFLERRDAMWKLLLEDQDYTAAAERASEILQDASAFDAIHVAGLALTKLGHEEAFEWCCASLSLAKAAARWYANCAKAFMDMEEFPRAMLFVQNGLEIYPEEVTLLYQRQLIYCNMRQWQDTIDAADDLLEIHPEFVHATMTKGFALHMLRRYDEALACYMDIRERTEGSDYEDVINNWSCLLMEQGKQAEALETLEKYCREPDRKATVYNKSFIYLGMGRWPEGWHMYRTRETTGIIEKEKILPMLDLPFAKDIEEITGKAVFFFHEQGLGDDIMFIRYASVLSKYVKKLIVGVPPSMARLASRLIMESDYEVLSGADFNLDKGQIAQADYIIPMLDAPGVLQQTVADIPNEPYFLPVPEALVHKRSIEGFCRPHALRVGICWAGNSRPENMRANSIDQRRSMTYEQMLPLIDQFQDRCDFISLQQSNYRVDDKRIIQPIGDDFDVLDTAAVIDQLHLVITIDSSMAHLPAAFWKPTWMLSRLDACWRWFWPKSEDDWFDSNTQWYPTMRIFRQREAGDWASVIDRVSHGLQKLLDKR